jgi:hypothetical protein
LLSIEMHRLYHARVTPAAEPGTHCQSCSLVGICLPKATAGASIQQRWRQTQACSLREEM